MQISLRGKRKLPECERTLCKWHGCIKSTVLSSATNNHTGVEVVPLLMTGEDKKTKENFVE